MINVSPALATVIMFGSLLLLIMLGLPVMFALGGVGIMAILLFWGPGAFMIEASAFISVVHSYSFIAIPLFVFMAVILQHSGVIDALFKSMLMWSGPLKGGLAMGVVFICTIVAAMSGLSATGTLTMGVLALPVMLKLGYDKTIAIGPIMVGGGLGSLIPPSVSMVVFGTIAEVSIGRLFLGGIVPGLILSFFYMAYIGIRCYLNPKLGPALPPEERGTWRERITSIKGFILPLFLIIACLLPIFLGIASPTEAASVGAIGSLVCAAVYRRISWRMISDTLTQTFILTGKIMWIIISAYAFKAVFLGLGGPEVVKSLVSNMNVAPLAIVFIMQLSYIFLGCFLDVTPIILITVPVYSPILQTLGFDPVWFGVLFIINMEMGFITPPFGFGLFYMRSVAPAEITTGDIYRSILPFLPIIMAVLLLVLFFPQLALWIPNTIFGPG